MQHTAPSSKFVTMQFVVDHVEGLAQVSHQILEKFPDERIFLFYGHMGAGKTTLVNALCAILGVQDSTSSPTFSIVNEYAATPGPLYHFDFYRIKDENEALDLGYEEYFYSGNYCFVEWPEKIANLLPSNYLKINIEAIDNQSRSIIVEKI